MTTIRRGLRKIEVSKKNNLPPEIVEGNFIDDLYLQNTLRTLQDNKLLEDYVWDVKEYPKRVKKIYVKGQSRKQVPRQVLDIKTNSFISDPKVYYSRLDTTFTEL